MRLHTPNGRRPRRGLTLVEMLVTVALVLLIMVIITSVFRSAATATSRQKVAMELEQILRRVDSTFRQDLQGVTAKMDPSFEPARPDEQRGYFEYGENSLADIQGEDSDDYLAFTAKAPDGQPFRGFIVVQGVNSSNPNNPQLTFTRVPITSNYAEIIYFVRHGNLYRRVLLIVPERKGQLTVGPAPGAATADGGYYVVPVNGGLGSQIVAANTTGAYKVSWHALNTISARPAPASLITGAGVLAPVPNSLGDLTNRENRFCRPRFSNDYLTRNANGTFTAGPDGIPDDLNSNGIADYYPSLYPSILPLGILNDDAAPNLRGLASVETLGFPFVFPGDYSTHGTTPGGFHVPDKDVNHGMVNHNPIATGAGKGLEDPLLINQLPAAGNAPSWWGFPTYQEMASANWLDPVWRINDPSRNRQQFGALTWTRANFIPLPWTTTAGHAFGDGNPFERNSDQPFADGFGSNTFAQYRDLWRSIGDSDDLLLTGVRSFDVKIYDPTDRGYRDLGWAYNASQPAQTLPAQYAGFGHQGRMPPLFSAPNNVAGDHRPDARYPFAGFVGDTDTTSANTVRMVRVWDSWSYDYSHPPDVSSLNPLNLSANGVRPVYPGFSAPYPKPMSGIQIHIRVTDPRNERIKILTIRQDFTDKLN
ncbi:MAG: prepilin-type N-terminal cleavage/methylation domain-containing protein [Isosphaeraceae bacterium]